MRTQSRKTAIAHVRRLLRRAETWDCTSIAEDTAIRRILEELERTRELACSLMWYIDNVDEDTPDRTERFFKLREQFRDVLWDVPRTKRREAKPADIPDYLRPLLEDADATS